MTEEWREISEKYQFSVQWIRKAVQHYLFKATSRLEESYTNTANQIGKLNIATCASSLTDKFVNNCASSWIANYGLSTWNSNQEEIHY